MIRHAAIFVDHHEARVFHFHPDEVDEKTLKVAHHLHHQHGSGKDHPEELARFFHEVAQSVADAAEVLVVGPSTAKLEFIRHLHRHDTAVERKVVGVETVDHPSDGQLIAYAKKYFERADRMR